MRGGETPTKEPDPPPPNKHTSHCRAPGLQLGTKKARHRARRARQRRSVSPRLRQSMPGQGARTTRRPSRAHTQRRTPARTTTQDTTAPRHTPALDDEQAAAIRTSRPQSPPAAIRMVMCAPSSDPSTCRPQNSRRPDEHLRARQRTQHLPATKQPPSGRTCEHLAVHAPSGGYDPKSRPRWAWPPVPPGGANAKPSPATHPTKAKPPCPTAPASTKPSHKLDRSPHHPEAIPPTPPPPAPPAPGAQPEQPPTRAKHRAHPPRSTLGPPPTMTGGTCANNHTKEKPPAPTGHHTNDHTHHNSAAPKIRFRTW